jgi:hypothetical protein
VSDLGELGEAVAPHDHNFDYFGSRLRVHPDFCELDLVDFVEESATIDEESAQAMVALKNFFRCVIHPDDFTEFWRLSKANRQSAAQLMHTIWTIVEALSGRPTKQPSDSSSGQTATVPTSTAGSSSVTRAMRALEGRPDLQLAVVRAQQGQAAA